MDDLISRQDAIEIIQSMYPGMPRIPWVRKVWQERYEPYIRTEKAIKALPSVQPEPLTDKEKRIFLSAMGREEKVCKQVDDDLRVIHHEREPIDKSLVRVCHEITRKVKGALWTL